MKLFVAGVTLNNASFSCPHTLPIPSLYANKTCILPLYTGLVMLEALKQHTLFMACSARGDRPWQGKTNCSCRGWPEGPDFCGDHPWHGCPLCNVIVV